MVAAQPVGSGFGRAVEHGHACLTGAAAQGGDPLEHATGSDRGGERGDPAALTHHVLLHFHGDERGVAGIDEGGEVVGGDRGNVTEDRQKPEVVLKASGGRAEERQMGVPCSRSRGLFSLVRLTEAS